VLIIPEVLILSILMYRCLSLGEQDISIYETGSHMGKAPSTLTTQKRIISKSIATDLNENKRIQVNYKMLVLSMGLTIVFFLA